MSLMENNKLEEIQLLSSITEQINAGFTLDNVLDKVFESFRSIIPYNRIGFALLEEEGKVLRARCAHSDASDIKLYIGYSAPMKGSSLQRIIDTGKPRILNDLETYLQEHPDSDSTRKIVEEGIRSSLTCPLIAMGKPIGFMFFSSMAPKTYKDVHVELFLQIAGQLALTVEKSRLHQQLMESNELKNKFLGIVAHDLRNPVSVIKNYIGLFLAGILKKAPERQDDIFKRMDKVCNSMIDQINDLLDISAIEAGRLDLKTCKVDIAKFLQEFCEENSLLAKAKSIELKMDLQPELPWTVFDSKRINQVLANLVSNAIKFSHPDTAITIEAKTERDKVKISVRDQGQGIPQKDIPILFSEFERASVRSTAGERSTGLGLAIVKRIIKAHEGKVWVESKVNVGSSFTFTLPVKGPQHPASS